MTMPNINSIFQFLQLVKVNWQNIQTSLRVVLLFRIFKIISEKIYSALRIAEMELSYIVFTT